MLYKPNKGYRKSFSLHGESPKSLQWKNYKSAANRYREIIADLDIDGKSVLDVGCGMGDLLPYLYSKTNNFDYLGVDIVPEFIEVAKKRYEGHDFRILNPFKEEMAEKFDVIVLCGALNANKNNWLNERFQKVSKLYSLANEEVVFNMAGGFGEIPIDERVAYARIPEVIDFCSTLSSRIILRAHYNSRDFTVLLFK